jgi:hypothetical protein
MTACLPAEFWSSTQAATVARAVAEGWTQADCKAAVLQSSLLSFRAHPDESCGRDCSPYSPENLMHNAPWNDWTAPSKGYLRFEAAMARKKQERIDKRVRVRLCGAPNYEGLRHGKIVFATVEIDSRGVNSLLLRRGATILAALDITQLQVAQMDERLIRLSTDSTAAPVVYLSFENRARVSKFWNMLTG